MGTIAHPAAAACDQTVWRVGGSHEVEWRARRVEGGRVNRTSSSIFATDEPRALAAIVIAETDAFGIFQIVFYNRKRVLRAR